MTHGNRRQSGSYTGTRRSFATEELTTREAATLKGVTPATIQRAIKQGRLRARVDLPPGRAHGVWRVLKADLEAWRPITGAARGTPSQRDQDIEAARRAAIIAATGSMAGNGRTLEDFLREKREDLEREEHRPFDPAEGLKYGD